MLYGILIFIIILVKFYRSFIHAEKIICRPPNKFVHIFAPPGTGKTTYAAKIVRDNIIEQINEENKPVYSNVPIVGAIQLKSTKDLGKYLFKDCIIIFDEAGTQLSNRTWHVNLDIETIEFIKKHRHYNADIYVFSQSHGDIDNKFRELTTRMLMIKKSKVPFKLNAISIKKTMDLINGQIVEFYEWDKSDSFNFYNPMLWAYFNSYDIDKTKKEYAEKTYYTRKNLG